VSTVTGYEDRKRIMPARRGRPVGALLRDADGFTLIELLVAIGIIAILVVMAVPVFLKMTTRARIATAESNVRIAVPAAVAYSNDTTNNPTPSTYTSISGAKLRLEANGIGPNVEAGSKTVSSTNDAFCIQDTEDQGSTFYRYEGGRGGAAVIVSGACPASYNVA
jgi:prepilin-type N-terminal cleavage/methylation domain-containing protein